MYHLISILINLSNIKKKKEEVGTGVIESVMVVVGGYYTYLFSCIYINKGKVAAALLHTQKFFIHDYI